MTMHRFFFLTLSLVAVLVAVSCAPAAVTPIAVSTDVAIIPTTEALVNSPVPEATASVSTQVPAVEVVATSRGPNLEATDPSTVNLASGQLQLVEFFRFT